MMRGVTLHPEVIIHQHIVLQTTILHCTQNTNLLLKCITVLDVRVASVLQRAISKNTVFVYPCLWNMEVTNAREPHVELL